jgi:hypothetical protein
VYESCSNLLFRRWDARRRIHVELRARHLVEPALRHLAFWLFTRGQAQAAVTERDLIGETARFLHSRGFESQADADDAAREFVSFCRGRAWVFSDAGTTAEGQPLYAFTHRTFLEYFAAAYLAATCDTPEKLARAIGPHVARQEWEGVADLATQIKDRTTDRGAERIMAALLTERRYRSTQSRSHVLEFLAYGMRFVDPPPRIARDLSRNILDHAFSGDPDDDNHCHPLHHLVVGCTGPREIVRDEINERASALTNSTDPANALNGLRLAVWVDDRNIQAQNSRVGNWDQGLWQFWKEQADASVTTHADAIIAAAQHNTAMSYTALVRGLVTVEQILTGASPNLEVLFTTQPTFFGIVGPPYLFRRAYDLIRGRRWHHAGDPIPDFGAFGHFAMEHPSPPFVTNPDGYGSWLAELNGSTTSQELPDPVTHLGASLAFAIGAEASDEIPAHRETAYQFGPLSDLSPYIMRRYKIDSNAELPDLPFPAPFTELFKAWANREVDFTRTLD